MLRVRSTSLPKALQNAESSSDRTAKSNASFSLSTLLLFLTISFAYGCGTTKFSDTGRTATEQLLISSAMEDLADGYDYSRLSGLKVFVKCANTTTDSDYLTSLIRQQLAANGAFVKDSLESADYIVEIAPGTVGTNRYELMYGIPETTVPAIGSLTTATSIPEFALIKRTDQKAQVKLVMWAYNKTTGSIIWQSGIDTKTAQIRDRWIFGAGPFSTATYDEAGIRLGADQAIPKTFGEEVTRNETTSVRSDAVYHELDEKAIERLQKIREEGLVNAVEEVEEETLDTEDNVEENEEQSKPEQTLSSPLSDKSCVSSDKKTTTAKGAREPTYSQDYELDLGYGSKINPGFVYVPSSNRY